MASGLDLPLDLALDVPRVTVVAGISLTVENHRGLLAFGPERVRVAAANGSVEIEGTDLRVGVVHGEEITVTGRLRSVVFLAE